MSDAFVKIIMQHKAQKDLNGSTFNYVDTF